MKKKDQREWRTGPGTNSGGKGPRKKQPQTGKEDWSCYNLRQIPEGKGKPRRKGGEVPELSALVFNRRTRVVQTGLWKKNGNRKNTKAKIGKDSLVGPHGPAGTYSDYT